MLISRITYDNYLFILSLFLSSFSLSLYIYLFLSRSLSFSLFVYISWLESGLLDTLVPLNVEWRFVEKIMWFLFVTGHLTSHTFSRFSFLSFHDQLNLRSARNTLITAILVSYWETQWIADTLVIIYWKMLVLFLVLDTQNRCAEEDWNQTNNDRIDESVFS